MKRLLSCEFNMDTACVELKFANGSMIAIVSAGSAQPIWVGKKHPI